MLAATPETVAHLGFEQMIDEVERQQGLHAIEGKALPRLGRGEKAQPGRVTKKRRVWRSHLPCLAEAHAVGNHGLGQPPFCVPASASLALCKGFT